MTAGDVANEVLQRLGKPTLRTIAQCGGVKAQAAEVLDVSLKTIYNRLAQLEDEAEEKPDA